MVITNAIILVLVPVRVVVHLVSAHGQYVRESDQIALLGLFQSISVHELGVYSKLYITRSG